MNPSDTPHPVRLPLETKIRLHQRGQEGVLRKITKLYPHIPEDMTLPEQDYWRFVGKFENRLIASDKWQGAKQKAADASGIDLEQIDASLDDLAREAGMCYAQAAALHQTMKKAPNKGELKPYRDVADDDTLAYIYKNHLTNEFDARLRQLGLNDASAYKLQGRIIQTATDLNSPWFSGLIESRRDYVFPQPVNVKGTDTMALNTKRMHNYWRVARDHLEERYWEAQSPKPSFLQRLLNETPKENDRSL